MILFAGSGSGPARQCESVNVRGLIWSVVFEKNLRTGSEKMRGCVLVKFHVNGRQIDFHVFCCKHFFPLFSLKLMGCLGIVHELFQS